MPVQANAPAQLVVIYNGFKFDETNSILIDAADEIADAYLRGSYSFEFTVRVTTPSSSGTAATDVAADIGTFRALVAAVVNACRVPRARLQIQYGGVNAFDWNPTVGSNLSAFHVAPQLTPLPGPDDSLTAKRFRLTITFDHPADLAGQNGRQDSTTGYEVTVRARRVAPIAASFTALTTNDALAQYKAATTDTWFTGQLPTPVAGGAWTLVDERPSWDDEGTGGRVLTVTRVYWEHVNGLREWTVTTTKTPSQAVLVTIAGTYISTSTQTAKAAHDADASSFVLATLAALFPGVSFDAKPSASSESKTTVDGVYPFSVSYEQIVYPQGPGGNDDANVTTFTLSVTSSTPFDPNTIVGGVTPQSLVGATAVYSAAIDVNSASGTDMQSLWDSKYKAHCAAAIKAKLKASNIVTRVVQLGLDLTANRIAAQLSVIVIGANVISLLLSEQIDEAPAGNPVPMAVAGAHEYWLFWGSARLVLTRVAQCEYVSGTSPPDFWAQGSVASGLQLTDVGWPSWDAARDAVNKRNFALKGSAPASSGGSTVDRSSLGSAPTGGGWYPLTKTPIKVPKTVGDAPGLSTVTLGWTERWLFMAKCTTSQGAGAGTSSPNRTPTFSGLR